MNINESILANISTKVFFYWDMQQYDAAEKTLIFHINEYPKIKNFHNLLGVNYFKKKQFTDSVKQFEQALQYSESFAEASLNLIIVLCDLGEYQKAQEVMQELNAQMNQRTYSAKPDYIAIQTAEEFYRSGMFFFKQQMFQDSLIQYQKAIELNSKPAKYHIQVTENMLALHQRKKAQNYLEKIIEKYPDEYHLHLLLGLTYLKDQRKNTARKHFELAYTINSDDPATKTYMSLSKDWPVELNVP